jgi:nucleotide-binding universal stress UspA family protein
LPRIAILWDDSRGAARAAADALPLLVKAEEVRVVTITGEKPVASPGLSHDLVRHLQAHGVKALGEEVDGARRDIGAVIDAVIAERRPQLLVMGAFGSPRLKEFVLGGATRHVLDNLSTPTLMSH